LAGAAISPAPEAVQEKVSMPAAPASAQASAPSAQPPSFAAKQEEKKPAAPAPAASIGGVDRAAIARVVENVLAAQGIARGSGASKSNPAPAPTAKELTGPSSIATEIADRFFGPSAKPQTEIANPPSAASSGTAKTAEAPVPSALAQDAVKRPEPPAKITIEIQGFVSENDVRRAMTRSEKIFIGRKTILTPSARDLGLEHEVFVETEAGSIR
jgi:hypothetical protein